MKTIHLYWNHICILHGFEKKYLKQVQEKLKNFDIDLNIHFFGLGYETHMAEYLLQEDAKLPDLIVSADLEVFEQPQIFHKLGELHSCESWYDLKNTNMVQQIRRKPSLLPLVIIPMILYSNYSDFQKPLFQILEQKKLGFGGINNSAAKTVIKAIWERYGKEMAEKFLANEYIRPMPIGAFQDARLQTTDAALVPSLYALRADDTTSFALVPEEGPVLLPSYFCARRTISETDVQLICEHLLSEELFSFYVQNGDLISCLEKTQKKSSQENQISFLCVHQNFLDTLDAKEFYNLYCQYLSDAHNLS